MANVIGIKRSSTESIVVLVDGLCIRCDQRHTEDCLVTEEMWKASERFRKLRDASMSLIVRFIRFDRVNKVVN